MEWNEKQKALKIQGFLFFNAINAAETYRPALIRLLAFKR
jgi:hypothetical protein